jgi:hypothetical protein
MVYWVVVHYIDVKRELIYFKINRIIKKQCCFGECPYCVLSFRINYLDDTCTDHFTPQQEARMHCYIDLVYQPMRDMERPAPVPVPPRVSVKRNILIFDTRSHVY